MELMNYFFNKYPKNSSTLRSLRHIPVNEENVPAVAIETASTGRKNTVKNLECRIQFLEK